MITFDIPDMTCGHCAAAITRALRQADPQARIDVDPQARQARVEPATADAATLAAAIQVAGYTARPVEQAPAMAAPGPRTKGCATACGCGCR